MSATIKFVKGYIYIYIYNKTFNLNNEFDTK